MLTFITLSRNIGDELPKLSYLKAVEIWFFVCIAFIFLSLVEFAFVNIIYRRGYVLLDLYFIYSSDKEKLGVYCGGTLHSPRPFSRIDHQGRDLAKNANALLIK